MMKRSMLMIALVLAGSTAQAVKRQETVSPVQENTLRKDAQAKIEAIKTATTFAELNTLTQRAQEAINKVPGHTRDLNAFHAATVTAGKNVFRNQAARTPEIFVQITQSAAAALAYYVDTPATTKTAYLRVTLADGSTADKSYSDIAAITDNQIWQQIMKDLPAYAKEIADGIELVIENWLKDFSKDEVAKLKADKRRVINGTEVNFNNIQGLLKQFHVHGERAFVKPARDMADATKKAEFEKAIRPITNVLEKYKKVLTDKGFTL